MGAFRSYGARQAGVCEGEVLAAADRTVWREWAFVGQVTEGLALGALG